MSQILRQHAEHQFAEELEALRKAEQDKTATISQPQDISTMAAELSRRGSQTFSCAFT